MANTSNAYQHLFGPVPSRRLGRSLGIDLTPGNTCSYDCIYCQLGATACKTTERREYVPTREVINELRSWKANGNAADVVTLAGSGEPTLHTGFGAVLEAAREICNVPTVLLTNGSLLHDADVRNQAQKADIVKVTFSAGDKATWQRLHRPSEVLAFEQLQEGLAAFRKDYNGTLWIEIMVVQGINDQPETIQPISDLVKPLHADQIQINTVVRPPAQQQARAAEAERLEKLAEMFDPAAVIIGGHAKRQTNATHPAPQVLCSLACRHPLTADEAAAAFGLDTAVVAEDLENLARQGAVKKIRRDGKSYFTSPDAI